MCIAVEMQGSAKTRVEVYGIVRTRIKINTGTRHIRDKAHSSGTVVKHSYKSRLEVHSSATAGATRSQAEVRLRCTVMPVGLPSSALQSKKSMALSKQDQI